MTIQKYEGYWRKEKNPALTKQGKPLFNRMPWDTVDENNLPFPEQEQSKYSDQFIQKLKRLLNMKAKMTGFFGWSDCRFCSKPNGTKEYYLTSNGVECTIPEGYLHYLEDHNVHPSKEFIDFINQF